MNFLTWYRKILRNPKYRWWIIVGSLVYLLSPIDISPDVFPIFGQIDDLAVLTLLLSAGTQMIMENIRKKREEELGQPFEPEGDGAAKDGKTVDVDAVSMD